MPAVSAALAYARIGWPVVPCRGKEPCESWPLRGERPRRDDGTPKGYNGATTDQDKIRHWWRRYPDANIGLAAGHAFFALDVDGTTGEESLATLMEYFGELPDTLTQFTGGGGVHLLFQPAPGLRNWASRFCLGVEVAQKLGFQCTDNGYATVPGIDIITTGKGIIGAPSVHPSGRLYRWKKGHGPTSMLSGNIHLATAPDWLIKIATPPPETNVAAFPGRTCATGASEGFHPRYIEEALARACAAVRQAIPGTRDATLHREAWSIGGLVGDQLSEQQAFEALYAAGIEMEMTGEWTHRRVAWKITRALRLGMMKPRFPAARR